ncbi:MAG: hypothetical protein M1818_002176 [Claussenomyces sp. TS43310]|nr:MAG: hypothetical protein M1818_002176 [Claussenomyces sp. TS43310]
MAAPQYTLPTLPYAYDALEPHISKEIMTLHHSKHHQAYINNLNAALQAQQTATSKSDIVEQVHLRAAINFNGGGHINHSLFWHNLAPASSPSADQTSVPRLTQAIEARWGTIEAFKEAFKTVLLSIQGSGWGWLVQDVGSGHLEIVTTRDQDIAPVGKKPILGVDMWEHAYYLQYRNEKLAYVTGIWSIVNWATAEQRFLAPAEQVYAGLGLLKAAM